MLLECSRVRVGIDCLIERGNIFMIKGFEINSLLAFSLVYDKWMKMEVTFAGPKPLKVFKPISQPPRQLRLKQIMGSLPLLLNIAMSNKYLVITTWCVSG